MNKDNTYNGCESKSHWNTALWLNNDEEYYHIMANAVEQVVYMQLTKEQAIQVILERLPKTTGDGYLWERSTLLELFEEQYQEQLKYS